MVPALCGCAVAIPMKPIPALIAVLGGRAWWMPRWLDRLMPNVSLEGGHDDRAARVGGVAGRARARA
jgi:putative drug exporter of the RND superfamily